MINLKLIATNILSNENKLVYEIIYDAAGTRYSYLDGELDGGDGPAVEKTNGDKEWYINGELNREDGPAIEHANGDKYWYVNDKLHREDGPAVEYANGRDVWYLDGHKIKHDSKTWSQLVKDSEMEREIGRVMDA